MEPFGALVKTVLDHTEKQHAPLFTLQAQWSRLVGRALARRTKPVSLRRGRLVIHATHPGEHFALSYQRPQLLTRLRAVTGGRVEELVVRAGDV
jgi:hypothetical protein